MAKAQRSRAPSPVCLAIQLDVVETDRTLMFHDPVSGRATTELSAKHFPVGTSLDLSRHVSVFASASVACGGDGTRNHQQEHLFVGDSCQIVVPDPAVMRACPLPKPGAFYAQSLKAKNFLLGDVLILKICAKDVHDPTTSRDALVSMFRRATRKNVRAVLKELMAAHVRFVVGKLLDEAGVGASTDIVYAWGSNPWREQLHDALRLAGELKPKKHSRKEVIARLRTAADAEATVIIVTNKGERVRGRPSRAWRGTCLVQVSMQTERWIKLTNIRRVIRVVSP